MDVRQQEIIGAMVARASEKTQQAFLKMGKNHYLRELCKLIAAKLNTKSHEIWARMNAHLEAFGPVPAKQYRRAADFLLGLLKDSHEEEIRRERDEIFARIAANEAKSEAFKTFAQAIFQSFNVKSWAGISTRHLRALAEVSEDFKTRFPAPPPTYGMNNF